jgi:hypothetical protein
MNIRLKFRILIILFLLFGFVIDPLVQYFDSGELIPAYELIPSDPNWYFSERFYIYYYSLNFLVIGQFIGLFGVLLYKNWGRWLYSVVSCLLVLIGVVKVALISYGWEAVLWEINNMLAGAIILAMFLRPISNEFNKVLKTDS